MPAPAWATSTAPGYHRDVPANFPEDIRPAIYAAGFTDDAFIQWSGGAYLTEDDSCCFASSGHHPGGENFQSVLRFHITTATWSARCTPLAVNPDAFAGPYPGMGIGQYPDGTMYMPHTYLSLADGPGSWFVDGHSRLVHLGFPYAGGPFGNVVWYQDVTQTNGGYGYILPTPVNFYNQTVGSVTTGIKWHTGQGWFFTGVTNYNDHFAFVSKTGVLDQTTYPDVVGKFAHAGLVIDEVRGLAIGINGGLRFLYEDPTRPNTQFNSLSILDLTTHTTTAVSYGPDLPLRLPLAAPGDGTGNDLNNPEACSCQWSPERDCIFLIDSARIPPRMIRITPPTVGDRRTTNWTSVYEDTIHDDANDPGGRATYAIPTNDYWNRVLWIPYLDGLLMFANNSARVQFIRPAGVGAPVPPPPPPPPPATRTATITLESYTNVLSANLTGLSWCWFEVAAPNLYNTAAPLVKGSNGTTNASGVFSVPLPGSALGSGGIGSLLVCDSTGVPFFNGPVAVT